MYKVHNFANTSGFADSLLLSATVTDANGSTYTVRQKVYDADGTAYIVDADVTDADVTPYTIFS